MAAWDNDPVVGTEAQPQAAPWEHDPVAEEQGGVGQILKTAGQAALETIKGLIPTSGKQLAEFATPVVGAIEDIAKAGKSLSDIAFGGKGIDETVKANFPESQMLAEAEKTPPFSKERFEAGFGVLGQFATAAGIGRGLRPTLRELAFGKEAAPLASETAAVEQIQKGGPSATEPNRETGALPTEQGKPAQQETAVQPETRDTRETPAEAPAQEVVQPPKVTSEIRGQEMSTGDDVRWMSGGTWDGKIQDIVKKPSGTHDVTVKATNGETFTLKDAEHYGINLGRSEHITDANKPSYEGWEKDYPDLAAPVSEPTETTTAQPLTQEKGGEVGEKVQVQGEDEGKGKEGVLTHEAATVQPPAAPPVVDSSEPQMSRIANRFTQERSASGEIGEIAPGQGYSTKELLARGLKMPPEQINQHISDLMQRSGGDPIEQASAVRANEAQLSQRSNQLSREAEADPNNIQKKLEADNAFKDLTDFHNGPLARIKEIFHGTGQSMQQEIPIDLSTFNGMKEAWLKDTGKSPPPEVEPLLRTVSKKVAGVNGEADASVAKLGDAVEQATKRRKLPTHEQVRDSILERLKNMPCK